MDPQIYTAFVVATAIMLVLPGPSVFLTLAHSISFGWRPALATVAGATVGIAVQLVVAAVGLTSLLNLVAEAFEWLRWAGAAYLVYLGIKQWKRAGTPLSLDVASVARRHLFFQGLVVTVPNPKSLIFIAAFLPQFIDPTAPAGPQFACIVPTFLLLTFFLTAGWALAAGKAGRFFRQRRAMRALMRTAGGMMVIAGAGLVLARRGS